MPDIESQLQKIHADLTGLRLQYADTDKRVAVLETQRREDRAHQDDLRGEVSTLRHEIKEMAEELRAGNARLHSDLQSHMRQELHDRIRLMREQRATLLAAIGGLLAAALPHIVHYLRAP